MSETLLLCNIIFTISMITSQEKQNGISVIHVKKEYTDEEMERRKNTLITRKDIKLIITEDTDVYSENNKLLLKFRRNKINKKCIGDFYTNVIGFAKKSYSTNRGSVSASNTKNVLENPKVFSNVIGFMDNFSPKQKYLLKQRGKTVKYNVRECRFNSEYPDKYARLLCFIQEIDKFYKMLVPYCYKKQYDKANDTFFRIPKTSFTTITTNVNFQTSIHKDRGDDSEGFGNLSVIEHGSYDGAETCFPQYGIGVDVRTGDILFMDVHEWHANLPLVKKTEDVIRLSVVCYLRYNVWKNTRNVSKEQMMRHNATVKNIKGHSTGARKGRETKRRIK